MEEKTYADVKIFFIATLLVAVLLVLMIYLAQSFNSQSGQNISQDNSSTNDVTFNVNNDNNIDSYVTLSNAQIVITENDLVASSGAGNLNVAEFVIDFDESILQLEDIVPGTNLLSLNETINNTTGLATIDIAQARSDFSNGRNLITLNFSVIQNEETTVRLIAGTTYGSPDRLDWAKSTTQFTISPGDTSQNPRVPLYRFYRPATKAHLYTIREQERRKVINRFSDIYIFEGEKNRVLPNVLEVAEADVSAVYRFYNASSGTHRYSINSNLIQELNDDSRFRPEGIKFHAFNQNAPDREPFYEFFNTSTGGYFYTSREREKNKIQRNLPQFDLIGVSFYVLPKQS